MDELVADLGAPPPDARPTLPPLQDRASSRDRRDEILRSKLMELVRREVGPDMGEDDMRRLVDEAIAPFAGARVRNFVSILAWRRVRTKLQISAIPTMDPYAADLRST
jgi:hypothetical protein